MKITSATTLSEFFDNLPKIAAQHARTSPTYQALERIALARVAESGFAQSTNKPVVLGGLGSVIFPFTKMGAVSSLDLFGLDELIIFSFYWANRNRYRRSADIGANLGLHSIIMAKCGWHVTAYEPDPNHAGLLKRNLSLNQNKTVTLVEAAVSDQPGTLDFIRVLGNTTSSHLAGAKQSAYGQLEKFPVRVETITAIMPAVDLVKLDAEGQEKIIILGTTAEHWRHTDMMVEVGTTENAAAIFEHLRKLGIRAYAQRLGWSEVKSFTDMPTSYKQGSLFITRLASMPWA
jgi:FkbM family methyltransferase